MRNTALHSTLEAFTAEAAGELGAEVSAGAEVPFEIVENGSSRGRAALYCYRPLPRAFIEERLGLLTALPGYAPAARALESIDGVEAYLRHRGEPRVPSHSRELADAALNCLLERVFAERTEFGFEQSRFEAAYAELEDVLYEGRCVTTVIAPLLGVGLSASITELALGEGLSLVRGDTLPDTPQEAVWGVHSHGGPAGEEPSVLVVLSASDDRSGGSAVSLARTRFRRILTALRLFERGGYALGPIAWTRIDDGAWRAVPLGSSGRPRFVTLIHEAQEDELRAFCSLVSRRSKASGGEIAWALSRFEMGCERLAPFEALTDYLLALRAVLEPEGPSSGRLAQRLAVICAPPPQRAALAERTAHAISLERAVIAGLAPAEPGVDVLVDELAEYLRALLRDVLCGHLHPDLCAVADELLADAVTNSH